MVWECMGELTPLVGVSGLAELASRKYKPAAKCFLQASFDHCDCPEVSDIPLIRNVKRCFYVFLAFTIIICLHLL